MDGFSTFQNYAAFNDLHNFWMPIEHYKSLFRSEYLAIRLSLEPFNLNNVYFEKTSDVMNWNSHMVARDRVDVWVNRNYDKTRDENVKILDNYLRLCSDNNVRPIMFLITMTQGYMKHFKKKLLDEFYFIINEMVKKYPQAIFVDGWKFEGFNDKYFRDVDHLNIQGAAKFSTILNNVIENLEKG